MPLTWAISAATRELKNNQEVIMLSLPLSLPLSSGAGTGTDSNP